MCPDVLHLNGQRLVSELRIRGIRSEARRLLTISAGARGLQIKQEIQGVFDFMKLVYTTLGFEFQLALSTRPEKYMGDIELWNNAEKVCV